MVGESGSQHRVTHESGGATADDVEAEERATDEGMPERPEATAADADPPDRVPPRRPIGSPDHGTAATVEPADGDEEEDHHDLGGEA